MKLVTDNPSLNDIILEVSEIAGYLWQRGWAERNAGNISVNVTDQVSKGMQSLDIYPYFELVNDYPELASGYFFVSGTGKRMRDLAREPQKNTLFIHINSTGTGYWIISKDKTSADNFMPTSEFPTHLGIHQMIAQRGSSEKVVMHTHANELVAITQIKKYCKQDLLNKLLMGMHPETIVFIPDGVGFVPYVCPGTEQIAIETLKALKQHKVAIWEKHGVFAIGDSAFETFDLIDILGKAAKIYFMVSSSGHEPEGLSKHQLAVLKELSNNF